MLDAAQAEWLVEQLRRVPRKSYDEKGKPSGRMSRTGW